MKKPGPVFVCLLVILLYLLLVEGCTKPEELLTPTHMTLVPTVLRLQGAIGLTPTGKRQLLITWEYDTLNTNLRSWDITRNINDTTIANFVPLEIIRKPAAGFPFYSDTIATFQSDYMAVDSLDVYYRVIPNGIISNFVGQPSDVLHMIVRRN
jgi:hypothetical protein